MECLRRVARPVIHFVILCLLGVGKYVAAAHAGIISTDAIVQAEQAEQERDRVHNLLARSDIKAYLTARRANRPRYKQVKGVRATVRVKNYVTDLVHDVGIIAHSCGVKGTTAFAPLSRTHRPEERIVDSA